jgi:hypothetical protein
LGDYQSESDWNRWSNLLQELEEKRLRYNIENSPTKEQDKKLILYSITKIENELCILETIQEPVNPSLLQKLYSRCIGPSSFDLQESSYIQSKELKIRLEGLIIKIKYQSKFY